MLETAALPRLTVLRVELRALEPQLIPAFAGSALHGVLGRALWHTVCSFRWRAQCPGCPLFGRCAYPALFAARAPQDGALGWAGVNDQAPRPMVLAPEPGWLRPSGRAILLRAGDSFPFRLTLVGHASRELPVLAAALTHAAARGIGRARDAEPGSARRPALALTRIVAQADGRAVYENGRFNLAAAETFAWRPPTPVSCVGHVTVELVTPMRLTRNRRICSRPSPADFFAVLARRANLLAAADRCALPPPADEQAIEAAAATLKTEDSLTRLVCVRRFSSTQKQKMTWPGIIGRFSWSGETLDSLWPLLAWGEFAQLGKGAALGFGRYKATLRDGA